MPTTDISQNERQADLATAEHAVERYNYYLGLRNSPIGSTEHDAHLNKHERTLLLLADKYGHPGVGPSIIYVIKGEEIPSIAD